MRSKPYRPCWPPSRQHATQSARSSCPKVWTRLLAMLSPVSHGRVAAGYDQAAIGWEQGRKSGERRFEGLLGVVAIEMIGLDVQDCRDWRGEGAGNSGEIRKPPPERPIGVARPAAVAAASRHGAIDHRRIAARGPRVFRRPLPWRSTCHAFRRWPVRGALALTGRAFRHSSARECRVLRLDEVRDWRPKSHCYRLRTRHPRSPVGPHVRKSSRFLPWSADRRQPMARSEPLSRQPLPKGPAPRPACRSPRCQSGGPSAVVGFQGWK